MTLEEARVRVAALDRILDQMGFCPATSRCPCGHGLLSVRCELFGDHTGDHVATCPGDNRVSW